MKDIKINKLSRNNIHYIISNIPCSNQCVLLLRINVGSRDESNEIKGISHLLEHMFFQGTKKYPIQKDLLNEQQQHASISLDLDVHRPSAFDVIRLIPRFAA